MSKFIRDIDARINKAIAERDRTALHELSKELLLPSRISTGAFKPAIELTPTARREFAEAQTEAPAIDALGLDLGIADAALWLANRIARAERRISYETKVLFGFSGLRLVSEGDSWFQYPVRLWDIIDVLASDPDKAVLSLDAAGDEVADILAQSEYLDALERLRPDAFLLSAGGNDLLGDGRLANVLRPYEPGKPAGELIDKAMLDARVDEITTGYSRIIAEIAHEHPALVIIGHGYDLPFPFPDGRWLGGPLAAKHIPLDVGRDVVRIILDQFNDELARLQTTIPTYRHIDLRGKVDRGPSSWFDELHPLNAGYERAAAEFRKVLAAVKPQMTMSAVKPAAAIAALEAFDAATAAIDANETFFCDELDLQSGAAPAFLNAELSPGSKPPVRFEPTTHQESRSGTKIDRIVVHYTTSRSIEGTISWFKKAPKGKRASAHYIVGQDGELVQMVEDRMAAWHAAPINARSIGIEHVAALGDRITPAQAATSARLLSWLMSEYGIPKSGVIPHVCVKSTSCCGDLFAAYGGGAGKSCEQQTKALHAWMDSMGIPTAGAPKAGAGLQDNGVQAEPPPASLSAIPQQPSPPVGAVAEPARPAFDLAMASPSDIEPLPAMDPRLQWLVARYEAGEETAPTMSTSIDEVGVIARVASPDAWSDMSEVRTPTTIGNARNDGFIVTGRIPIAAIEKVRTQANVLSLKASQELRPMLDATVQEMNAVPPGQLPPGAIAAQQLPAGTLMGQGAIVGVIDYGADFAHQNLRRQDGSTRFLAIWDQDAQPVPGSPFGYGREHSAAAINHALGQLDPYGALGYDPANYDFRATGTHGTHVIDIAAGNGRGSQFPGVAPAADLIFVNVSHTLDPSGTRVIGTNFGDSIRLLEAVKYIFEKAGDAPCVINISLGTNGGPHDGTTLVEQGLDSMMSEKPNRAVVMAAGNAYEDGIHAQGSVAEGGTTELNWVVAKQPDRDIEMEVWYKGQDRISVELVDPSGVVRAVVAPGDSQTLRLGNRVVLVANRLNDPNNHDNMIGVFLARDIAPGVYTIRLKGDSVVNGQFHAWIERDNAGLSHFTMPHETPAFTIGSVSCSHQTISVGSYDGHKASTPISSFSSSGPTRDDRSKPEVSAPGHVVRAARSGSGARTTLKSGTSMAAPAVTGTIALMFAEAHAHNLALSIADLRSIITSTARKSPSDPAWHPRYGTGRVDAKAAVAAVIARVATAGPSTAAASNEPPPGRRRSGRTRRDV